MKQVGWWGARGARARRNRTLAARCFRERYGYWPGSRRQWRRAIKLRDFLLELDAGAKRMRVELDAMFRSMGAGFAAFLDACSYSVKG